MPLLQCRRTSVVVKICSVEVLVDVKVIMTLKA